jgi:hypothetical protein
MSINNPDSYRDTHSPIYWGQMKMYSHRTLRIYTELTEELDL